MMCVRVVFDEDGGGPVRVDMYRFPHDLVDVQGVSPFEASSEAISSPGLRPAPILRQ